MNFWDEVDLWVHHGWPYFRQAISRDRCWYFSAKARVPYWEAPIADGGCLVFGNETDGLPMKILEKHPERCFTIPMSGTVRSLNLATAVGIVLYDALRRLGYTADAGIPIHHQHHRQQAGAR